ncbi:MAG TPA: AMP-binding protein [Pseudonocardiaceae bacterium]|nr:AMP-binding protein [Pseudonocardiaceae bacterium]
MNGLHTLGRWTRDVAGRTPDRVAIDDGGHPVTYAELDRRAERLARVLCRYPPGARIATLTRNSADHVVVLFACAKAGLVLVPLSWRLAAREIADQLGRAEAALLLVEPDFADLAATALARLAEPVAWDWLGRAGIESGGPAGSLPTIADDDPLLMVYTSGTATRPKGVVLSHANCFWTNLGLSRAVPMTSDDVVLSVLPQFHVGGWNVQPLLAWWVGATVVLVKGFDAGQVLALIAGRSVTTMMGVPTNYLFLAEHPDFACTDLGSLRGAVVGGAPMPEPLLRTWHARGVGLVQGYGLSEAAPNVLCLPGDAAVDKLGFAGRPYPYVDVAIADPVTGVIRPDAAGIADGELLVRGPTVFTGYWRDPAATAHAMRDGWLHTGDLVHRDQDGYYRVQDRLDDMFVSGGENVCPSEVENALYGHPAVAEVAVVGRPDSRWGQVGMAFVVCRPGAAVTEGELIASCRAELAGFKVPKEIRFVGELPHNAVGKLVRRSLRPGQEGASR